MFWFLENYFKKFEVQNCLVCALYAMNAFPILPVRAYCVHQKREVKSSYFKILKFNFWLLMAMNAITLMANISHIILMRDACEKSSFSCFYHFSDYIFILCGILLKHFCVQRIPIYHKFITEWKLIIDNSAKYGFPPLITAQNCRHINIQLISCYAVFFALFPCFVAMGYFIHLLRPDGLAANDYFIYRFILTTHSGLSLILEILQYIQVVVCSRIIAKNTKSHILKTLNERKMNYNGNVMKKLTCFNAYFQASSTNFAVLNRYLTPLYPIWLIFAIITLITNSYLVIDQWGNTDNYFMASIIYLQVRSYLDVCILVFLAISNNLFDRVCILIFFFN